MKKVIALCLMIVVLVISVLTSCSINNYKPISIKYQNSDYAAYGDAFLANLLNNSKWHNDVAKCECDYTIRMENKREIFYHSESGTFVDYDINKSLTISEEDRVKLNAYFVDSICESEVHFFDKNKRCTACGYEFPSPGENQNEDDSNDIFYATAYPQDFEYNGRHYHIVQGDGLKTAATQEELGELLGYIIQEADISAFTGEYPNVDYVIDNGIYDYYANNRVAFYSLKADPDLSIICMRQLGEYVLYQEEQN